MKTITFYSYKGGVGRSLALSNIATRLCDFGKKVCILDFDIEAPGLHLKFSKYLKKGSIKRGLVDYIVEFSKEKQSAYRVKDYLVDINYRGALGGKITLLPAGNSQTQSYWRTLSSIDWKELFYTDQAPGMALFIDLKNKLQKEIMPDFLLIDSRTGITEISGITMLLLADEVVVMASNNEENLIGSKQIMEGLLNEGNNLTGKLPSMTFVMARIPYSLKPEKRIREIQIVQNAIRTIGNKVIGKTTLGKPLVIHSDRDLEILEEFRISNIRNQRGTGGIEEDYLNLFEVLTRDILTDSEKVRFGNIKESERLLEQAKGEKDSFNKITLLKEAIGLNTKSDDANRYLAQTYMDLGEKEQAVKYAKRAYEINTSSVINMLGYGIALFECKKLSKALELLDMVLVRDRENFVALLNKAWILIEMKKYEDVLDLFKSLLRTYPLESDVHNTISNYYRLLGNYDKALEHIYKALEIDPQNYVAIGTLAEINANLGNKKEFYRNIELSFVFGMTERDFKDIMEEDDLYTEFMNDERFIAILRTNNVKL